MRVGVIVWVPQGLAAKIGRRNLTADQFRISIGRRYLSEKKQGQRTDLTSGKNYHKLPTEKKLSKEYNVAPKTVRNYAKEAEQYEQLINEEPETAEKIRSGEATFKDILKERKKEKRQKQIEEVKQKIETEELEKPTGLFDVIVVDPPWNYGRSYDPEGSRAEVVLW